MSTLQRAGEALHTHGPRHFSLICSPNALMLERAIGVGSVPDLQSAAAVNAGLCYSQSNMHSRICFAAAVLHAPRLKRRALGTACENRAQSTDPFMTEKETVCYVKGGNDAYPWLWSPLVLAIWWWHVVV